MKASSTWRAIGEILSNPAAKEQQQRATDLAQQLSWPHIQKLVGVLDRRYKEIAPGFLEELVNLAESPEAIKDFRNEFPTQTRYEDDEQIITVRDQLKAVWIKEPRIVQQAVRVWFGREPIVDGSDKWLVLRPIGMIRPMCNLSARVAQAMSWYAKRCSICANPECGRKYVARRRDQKYCLKEGCHRYGNRLAANRYWRKKHGNS